MPRPSTPYPFVTRARSSSAPIVVPTHPFPTIGERSTMTKDYSLGETGALADVSKVQEHERLELCPRLRGQGKTGSARPPISLEEDYPVSSRTSYFSVLVFYSSSSHDKHPESARNTSQQRIDQNHRRNMAEDMATRATRKTKKQVTREGDAQHASTQSTLTDTTEEPTGQSTENEHLSNLSQVEGRDETRRDTSKDVDREDDHIEGQLTKDTVDLTEHLPKTLSTYRNLLSTTDDPGPLLVVNQAPIQISESTKAKLSDKETLWNRICEAKSANDESNAEFLLRIYLSLPKEGSPSNTTPSLFTITAAIHRSNSATAALPTQKLPDKSINFFRGSVPNHCNIGFTPFFDKNIREFRGPLPLTIFDKEWQEEAVSFHSGKRSKTDEKDGIYTGYEYPNEWTQSFSAWTSNFRSFLITYRDIYKISEFADWIVEHKANVDEIIATEGFLTGFRYDMIVRANAFAYRVETDKGASVVDISVMRKDIREKAWATTRKLDELDFTDNPYAQGGIKFGFDPKTGRPKLAKGHKSTSDVASHIPNGPAEGGYRGGSSRNRGGYRGRNLGPNDYSERYFDDRREGRNFIREDENRSWGQRGNYGNNRPNPNFNNQFEERQPNTFRGREPRGSGPRGPSGKKEVKEGKDL
ncbi:hypothetical protein PGTUg99_016076 [Puccinia graminis f. sp. tritici]|uniref:Uncharacterized protein n=1 Tax=Puccinia graminis f. sp. tritici TaxID=56615 RepID=A0A5B0R4Q2_PUCGR|nr:hypothetical protein PGTUg99_016076 [Puccinia graminis f. sp. tritici]